jgi:hypothetical protein
MRKNQIINQFTKQLIDAKERKNGITTNNITSTLILGANDLSFVNEACKSSGKISKSQVIYRKLEGNSLSDVQGCFQENTAKFITFFNLMSRNRKILASFDITEEPFYGDFAKAEDKLYLHEGNIAKGSEFYYAYLTVAITCNVQQKYILDGAIVPNGRYIEDYIFEMIKHIKKLLNIEAFLFDRGFASWGVIHYLKKLRVNYIIFWKKQGEWYVEILESMDHGEFKRISREEAYKRDKIYFWTKSHFVLIKQFEYKDKTYDWIFATNLDLDSASAYIKRYKKRWCIETIYRVTDDIRIFTTSTKSIIRYFLFMFTCFVYNIWRLFQNFLGEYFTLANFKTNTTIFLAKTGKIYPFHYDEFERQALKIL